MLHSIWDDLETNGKGKALTYAQIMEEKSEVYAEFMENASDATKRHYAYQTWKFMRWAVEKGHLQDVDNYEALIALGAPKIEGIVKEYIRYLKNKTDEHGRPANLKATSIRSSFTAIVKLLEMNDILINKKKLRNKIGKNTHEPAGMEPVTTKEIEIMLKSNKMLRTHALIHFLASTGCRPGAITDPPLKKKHLKRMDDNECYSVHIYAGSNESYWAFLTPEASQAMDDYLEWREAKGEEMNDDTPLFVSRPLNAKGKTVAAIRPDTVKFIFENLMKTSGVRREFVEGSTRYNKATMYMFRKRFNTIAKLTDANPNIIEKLMGHTNGLDGVYLQPTKEECYREFKKIIMNLTINPTERVMHENKNLKSQTNEEWKERLDHLEKMLHNLAGGKKPFPEAEVAAGMPTLEELQGVNGMQALERAASVTYDRIWRPRAQRREQREEIEQLKARIAELERGS